MARQFILLTPADGGLWWLAQLVLRSEEASPLRRVAAVASQGTTETLDFAGLAQRLCEREAGKAEVNIAQMSEVLADLRELVAADPKAVLEVLAGKIGG